MKLPDPVPFMKLPARWCHPMDSAYVLYLKGRLYSNIICRFELADGRVIDGPCELILVKGEDKSLIKQARPNKVYQQGFGLQ